ncbi:hypothetical protein D6D12_04768 [Aureobasidium pullulans]|uniref:Uncharacterized protein n=1 Tax=Aureobasidium pullulans TaxID=5580 RepID=A0AB74JVG4_AURPU|nr:hypothetical protein D6D12_04768 [Aureobasidium pullulans]THX45660.1 hypothetical protein D6D11_07259 [Aureobasidium pullulans]
MAATNDSEKPKPSSPLTSPKNDKIIDKKAAKQARKKANRKNKKGAAGTNDSLTIEVPAVSETGSTISPRTSPRLAALREKEEAAQEILVALEDKQEAAQEIVNELERKIKELEDFATNQISSIMQTDDVALRSPQFSMFPELPNPYPMARKFKSSEERTEVGHRLTRKIHLQDVTDPKNPKNIGLWAVSTYLAKEYIIPGEIIFATHAFSNNDLKLKFPNECMVVLWHNESGMMCAPMYTLSTKHKSAKQKLDDLSLGRQKEFMSITKVGGKWEGEDLANANGPPLRYEPVSDTKDLEEKAFVDVARITWIDRYTNFKPAQAYLTRASYLSLLDVVTYKQHNDQLEACEVHELYGWPETLPTIPSRKRTAAQRERWLETGLTETEIDADAE